MEKQLLKDAALCAIEFTEKYSGKDAKTKRYQALNVLAELTLANIDDGKEINAYDVIEKIKGKYSVEENR